MMAGTCTIVWFRRDLRLEDNPALIAAAKAGAVVPIFIWCAEEEGEFRPGRVSRWWLKQSLMHLDASFARLGCSLLMKKSRDSLSVLLEVARETKATRVFYNHLYDPVSLIRDHHVKHGLSHYGIAVQTFNSDLLYEPWEVCDSRGNPFTVFQAFWQKYLSMDREPDGPLLPPKRLTPHSGILSGLSAEELDLEDDFEKSSNALLARSWTPGWTNANKALEAFLAGPLIDYLKNRLKVDSGSTSMLSPHLHYGELSIRKVFHSVRTKQLLWATDGRSAGELSASTFLRALGFREYSRYLCFHFPFTHERSLLRHLRHFPWRVDEGYFKAWRQGRTGYPLVDAGMRELWATGWLHNRIRVLVSSFSVKFLQLPWRWGMKYFWDTLLDADLESDILGWQYISGSLPDGHELDLMKIPHIEGRTLDPEGNYVRRWLPELSRLPPEWIHEPWNAPPAVLQAAGIELGCNYPRPIVELTSARERLQQGLIEMWEHNAAVQQDGSSDGFEFGTEETMDDTTGNQQQQQQQQQQPQSSPESSHPDQMVPTLPNESLRFHTMTAADRAIPVLNGQRAARPPLSFPVNHRQQQRGSEMAAAMEDDTDSTAESSSATRRHYDGYSSAWFPITQNSRRRVDSSSYL